MSALEAPAAASSAIRRSLAVSALTPGRCGAADAARSQLGPRVSARPSAPHSTARARGRPGAARGSRCGRRAGAEPRRGRRAPGRAPRARARRAGARPPHGAPRPPCRRPACSARAREGLTDTPGAPNPGLHEARPTSASAASRGRPPRTARRRRTWPDPPRRSRPRRPAGAPPASVQSASASSRASPRAWTSMRSNISQFMCGCPGLAPAGYGSATGGPPLEPPCRPARRRAG